MNKFGGWSINKECFNKILEILPKGSIILEFGSGYGSSELSKYYEVYSIEHDDEWLNKYDVNYIYAPLKPIKEDSTINWYDVEVLKKILPQKYHLILVDGPPKPTSKNGNGRMGFIYNLNLFNLENVIIIFDDVERECDYQNLMIFIERTKRKYEIFESSTKSFAVVYPD